MKGNGISVGIIRVVGIPAFDEEATIAKVIVKTLKYADKVVVVDDGCTDDTPEIAAALGVTVLHHQGNRGYGEAISTLFKHIHETGGDILITLDGDGQHDPDDIPHLVEGLRHADLVIGSRFLAESKTDVSKRRRRGIEAITKAVQFTSGLSLTDAQSGFRAYNRRAIDVLRHAVSSGMGMSVELLGLASAEGIKITEVPITCKYEGLDTSTHNPWKHGIEVLATVFQIVTEVQPLRWLGLPALVLTVLGALFGSYAITFFIQTKILLVNYTVVSLSLAIYGAILFSSAINFYILSRIRKEIRR
ncbi:MAG: glycosyltransferase family 2 protein [Bacteroidetes bacterium]|nr:glycosyltransferase family 2 protein [Bacteroidota bacterium]